MMYQLSGVDFSELISREFSPGVASRASSEKLEDVFDCRTDSIRTADFDILRFSASFSKQLRVVDFVDTTHVSMHFQLSGQSNASISGVKGDRHMKRGQFNVINCVDPVSSFVFPKQDRYGYVCVGLAPDFFNGILIKCGEAYAPLLDRSLERKSFSLFADGAVASSAQLEVLSSIQKRPVADALMGEYLRAKVSELVLLSIDGYAKHAGSKTEQCSRADMDRLQGVKDYLDDNFLLPLSLEGIAREFMLNEFKLKKWFKLLFGVTVFGHIHLLRMRHAAILLQSSGLEISEIAAIVGYTSDSSFIRAFRIFYGCPPGKMRS